MTCCVVEHLYRNGETRQAAGLDKQFPSHGGKNLSLPPQRNSFFM